MEDAPRIMVVDDELGICKNVEKILLKNRFEVTRALSAREALEKMAKESFALLISDIVMPEMNGLELLKIVKKEWPLTKAIMMTAYASTDTAMKAVRLGALDYIPKPFTPDELRATVNMALEGQLTEVNAPDTEKTAIDTIDVDVPPGRKAVVDRQAGAEDSDETGRARIPAVTVAATASLEGFCEVGDMVCDIFRKLGATCKAGVKTSVCPQKKACKGKRKGKKAARSDTKDLIGIDQPFNYDEVVSVTGPEYIRNLHHEGISTLYYRELKESLARLEKKERLNGDVPVSRKGAARADDAAHTVQRVATDIPAPVVEITASADLEGFCETGAMVCDIFKKLGATCKAGTKSGLCPQKKSKKKRKAAAKDALDTRKLIGPDLPFDYAEVAAATSPDFVESLVYDGTIQIPYEKLKANYEKILAAESKARVDDVAERPVSDAILIVDDEVAVNNNIRKILDKKGYRTDQAVTKDEALEAIERKAYNIVLLDLKIPGVQGLELLKAIRDRRPGSHVIIITGYASIETAVEAARMGAVDYIPKPFTPDEIRHATDRAFHLAA